MTKTATKKKVLKKRGSKKKTPKKPAAKSKAGQNGAPKQLYGESKVEFRMRLISYMLKKLSPVDIETLLFEYQKAFPEMTLTKEVLVRKVRIMEHRGEVVGYQNPQDKRRKLWKVT